MRERAIVRSRVGQEDLLELIDRGHRPPAPGVAVGVPVVAGAALDSRDGGADSGVLAVPLIEELRRGEVALAEEHSAGLTASQS